MTELWLPFKSAMVRAMLENRKTNTRRLMKPQPVLREGIWEWHGMMWSDGPPYCSVGEVWTFDEIAPAKPGDILCAKESLVHGFAGHIRYEADGKCVDTNDAWPWKRDRLAGLFMPRKFCRIKLPILSVRAERIQDITEEDAKAEGAYQMPPHPLAGIRDNMAMIGAFACYWDSIRGPGAWELNQWAWVYTFQNKDKRQTFKDASDVTGIYEIVGERDPVEYVRSLRE